MKNLKDDIADLMTQKLHIKTALKEKNFQNNFVLPTSSPERREAQAKHKDFEQRLTYLRGEKKTVSEKIDVQKKEKQKAKKKYDDLLNDTSWQDRIMISKIVSRWGNITDRTWRDRLVQIF